MVTTVTLLWAPFGLTEGTPHLKPRVLAWPQLHREPEERHRQFSFFFLTCCICNKRVQNYTNPSHNQLSLSSEPPVRPQTPEAVQPRSLVQTLGLGWSGKRPFCQRQGSLLQ